MSGTSNATAKPEPSDSALRSKYRRLEQAYLDGIARDSADVACCLQRERRFTVAYNRMSRNKVWSKEEGPECVYYNGSVEEYKDGNEIWPRGRHLDQLSVYQQIWHFFRFMWSHTTPYKTVAVIMLMSIAKPFQVAMLGWVTQYIEQNPQNTPLWLYFAAFYGFVLDRFLYWWYETWVPLNSQRVQLRCVLLKKRANLPDYHPVALKWPSGRFNGLLKDVDDVINGIWQSCLKMFDDIVTSKFWHPMFLLELLQDNSHHILVNTS